MSPSEFVANYIQKCIQEGINSPPDMRSRAEKEIQLIDTELKKIDSLKSQQRLLRAVIKNLGGGAKESKSEDVMDFSTPEEELSADFKNLCIKICDEIERCHPEGVPASRIIHEIASIKEHKNGYSAIRWLGKRGIISRDENRLVVKGDNWDARIKE